MQAAIVPEPGVATEKGNPVPPTAPEPRILVSLATYNERDNLAPLIQEIRQAVPAADVLVIDDNSPDGTGDLADRLAVDDPHIRVMHRAGKLGLGTAILAGMRYAIDENYDYLAQHGRRLQPPPALPAGDPGRHEPQRRDDRLALRQGRRHGELAAVAPAASAAASAWWCGC